MVSNVYAPPTSAHGEHQGHSSGRSSRQAWLLEKPTIQHLVKQSNKANNTTPYAHQLFSFPYWNSDFVFYVWTQTFSGGQIQSPPPWAEMQGRNFMVKLVK